MRILGMMLVMFVFAMPALGQGQDSGQDCVSVDQNWSIHGGWLMNRYTAEDEIRQQIRSIGINLEVAQIEAAAIRTEKNKAEVDMNAAKDEQAEIEAELREATDLDTSEFSEAKLEYHEQYKEQLTKNSTAKALEVSSLTEAYQILKNDLTAKEELITSYESDLTASHEELSEIIDDQEAAAQTLLEEVQAKKSKLEASGPDPPEE